MSTQLIPFSFESHEIRVTDQNGNPWFVLRDLLEAMGTSTPVTVAIDSIKQGLGDGFNEVIPILDSLGREQNAIVVAESAATYLLSRSNTEDGRKLNRFIHVEILPALRKTGAYILDAAKAAPSAALDTAMRYAKEGARLARAFGFDRNMIALSANNLAKAVTGIDVLEYMGATHLLADPRGRTYTPSELGKMCEPPLSGVKFNLLLEGAGLQTKEFGAWMPTDAASGLFEWLDTGKRHSNGAPVKQIKWFSAVLGKVGGQKETAQ